MATEESQSFTASRSWLLVIIGIASMMFLVLGYFLINSNNVNVERRDIVAQNEIPENLSDFELGQYYFNHGDQADGAYDLALARHYYTKVLEADPAANPLVWHQLGRIDFIEGEFSSALRKFAKQIEYFGDEVPNVYYMIGLTYGYKARQSGIDDDWEKAAEGFTKYIELDPTAPWPRVDLSWVYFSQGKYEDMLVPLEEGLKHSPDNAWLLNMYGLALMNTGDPETASDYFVRAKEAAKKLTVEDWGRSYPGNDPRDWPQGLAEFRGAIEKNLLIVQEQ